MKLRGLVALLLLSYAAWTGCREPSAPGTAGGPAAETLKLQLGQSRKEILSQLALRFPGTECIPQEAFFLKKPFDGIVLPGKPSAETFLLICFGYGKEAKDDDRAISFGLLREVKKIVFVETFRVEPASEENLPGAWRVYERGAEFEGGDAFDNLTTGGDYIKGVDSRLHFSLGDPGKHTQLVCTFGESKHIDRMFFVSLNAIGVEVKSDGSFSMIYDPAK